MGTGHGGGQHKCGIAFSVLGGAGQRELEIDSTGVYLTAQVCISLPAPGGIYQGVDSQAFISLSFLDGMSQEMDSADMVLLFQLPVEKVKGMDSTDVCLSIVE